MLGFRAQQAQQDKINKLKQREADERRRMLELRNKSRANLDDEEEEEDMDVAESGWSRAPNLTAAAAAKPAAKKK